MDLDPGEAIAIALSLDISDPVIIIDDLKGRSIADKLNLRYSGTLGKILKAGQENSLASVRSSL